MKIIGIKGDGYHLVQTGMKNGEQRGFVASVNDKKRWHEQYVASIAKFGYWEVCEHDQELLDQIMTFPMVGSESLAAKWATEKPQPFEP